MVWDPVTGPVGTDCCDDERKCEISHGSAWSNPRGECSPPEKNAIYQVKIEK